MASQAADMDHNTLSGEMTLHDYLGENLERAAQVALAQRRQAGEVMTYFDDGWVLREHPNGHVERLSPVATFRPEDFPIER